MRAFSLIEIMVTVGLLSFIVLGLVAMFSQTQRAFTSSLTQTDVLETGRAVTEMLARELAEVTPSYVPGVTNFFVEVDGLNFGGRPSREIFEQNLPGSTHNRTNVIQRFFFLSRLNQEWAGIGYQVVPYPGSIDVGVGQLYRHENTLHNSRKSDLNLLSREFVLAQANNKLQTRIADGVVHLRLVAYDPSGRPITPFWPTNLAMRAHSARYSNASLPNQVDAYFVSNAVPAFLELELGVLESRTLQRLKSFGSSSPDMQRQFLSNNVAKVHLFRQRIPIRNVDSSVYQ